jgi:hypothetical protein
VPATGEGQHRFGALDPTGPPARTAGTRPGAFAAVPEDERVGGVAGYGAEAFQPTIHDLRISARVLLHISRQPRISSDGAPQESLTQTGIARALGTSQGAVSNVLRRLVLGGLLEVQRAHVPRRMRRIKVYQLTVKGEDAVRAFYTRFRL